MGKYDYKPGYPVVIIEYDKITTGLVTAYTGSVINIASIKDNDLVERVFDVDKHKNKIFDLRNYEAYKINNSSVAKGGLLYNLSDRECYCVIGNINNNYVLVPKNYKYRINMCSLDYMKSKFVKFNEETQQIMIALDKIVELQNKKNKERLMRALANKKKSNE